MQVAPQDLSAADRAVAEATEKAVQQMKAEGWKPPEPAPGKKPNPGAFGHEVHQRASEMLKGQKNTYVDVYVENGTNKVLGIGQVPEGVDPKTYTQVDVINTKQKLKVGVEIDTGKVVEVYDIKSGGGLTKKQLKRLKAVKYGASGIDAETAKIKTVTASLTFDGSTGKFKPNPRYGASGVKLLGLLGPAVAAYVLLSSDVSAAEFRIVANEYVKAGGDPQLKILWATTDLRQFLERFIDDKGTVAAAIGVVVREIQGGKF